MENNKENRNKIYRAAYKYAINQANVSYGICNCIYEVLIRFFDLSDSIINNGPLDPFYKRTKPSLFSYPEIYKQKPEYPYTSVYWYPLSYNGYLQRLDVLSKAICETL